MIYQAHIEHVGPHVADGLADNLLITFRADGPADCLDYALALRPVFQYEHARLRAGDRFTLGGEDYLITAVGSHALQALLELGHLTLVFDSASTPRHQGTLHLAGKVPALALLQGGYLIVKESAQ
ncbi:PTS sorbitol transporter [Raoultella ornithinolytica]|uniref:PTS glucitol/sorbitol transporter subunit IIA n=1 Tax=Raoultella ornithinolytica TaxID=54291 RepID=UPI0015D86B23|nr:PTS glucitol/sorbitol transporter subunit IIA [Raoultella ornithinolytica]EKV0508206.1 PTS sorbitol transporter [Raoultella ornithinolytica]EMF1902699.1 PTS sorbitol transporter [Raoultella ornithinolytica]QLJ43764.1 PTS sorbitol transporter [Raoultella ornithinolytica]HED3057726.1 PTS sorbitol transporter [Raoultella ornithinolytica]